MIFFIERRASFSFIVNICFDDKATKSLRQAWRIFGIEATVVVKLQRVLHAIVVRLVVSRRIFCRPRV